jgi:L-cysteine/cystine lyase
MPDAEKLAAVREALPALSAGIYLAGATAGPLPAETAAAMQEYAARELRTGRGHPDDVAAGLERLDEASAGVAAILATDVEAIALTHGAGDAIVRAADTVDWRPGDHLLTIDGNVIPRSSPGAVAARFGVVDDTVAVPPGGDPDEIVAAFEAALRPATRLVVVPHVLPTTGVLLPIEAIAAAAHARGALVAVDGSQAVGAVPVRPDDTGADFYAVTSETWLLGPEGLGALWARRGVADAAPRVVDGTAFHKPSVVGFARSCGWLSMYVGLAWIHARGTMLARAAADRLARIAGVEVLTPPDRMAAIVSFRIGGWPADDALSELGSRVFAIAGTIPELDAIRIGVGFYTSEAELDRFASGVELLAAHTPETLPPKPRLAILGQDDLR